jgi:phage terminase large subunit
LELSFAFGFNNNKFCKGIFEVYIHLFRAFCTEMKFNLKKIVSTPIYLIGIIFFTGCSLNKVVVNYFSDFAEDGIDVLYEEGDLVLAGEFLTSNLKVIEIMLSKDPENKKLNLIAAQGFGAYAFGFVEDSDPERASI